MMDRSARLRQLLEQPGTFVKWLVFAGISGVLCGGVATAFYYAFDAVTGLRDANPWLLWLLPLGGVAIVLLYRVCGMEGDRGTNFVLVAFRRLSSLLNGIFVINGPGIHQICPQMKLRVRHVEPQGHKYMGLAFHHQIRIGRHLPVDASAGCAAGHMHGSLRIHCCSAGGVIISFIRLTFPVRKSRAGVSRVMSGNHQVNIVVLADVSQRIANPRVHLLLILPDAAVCRIMLDNNSPL